MKIFRQGIILAALSAGSYAYGEEGLSVQLNQSVFSYGTSSSETKQGTTTVKEEGTSFSTMDNSLEVILAYGDYVFYIYPTQSDAAFAFGKALGENSEAGIILDHDAVKTEDDSSGTMATTALGRTSAYGLYGWHSLDAGPGAVELWGSYSLYYGEGIASGSGLSLAVSYVHPIGGGLSYYGGLGYDMGSVEMGTGTAKTEYSSTSTSIKLLGLRVDF